MRDTRERSARVPGVVVTVRRWLRCFDCKGEYKAYNMLRLRRSEGAFDLYCFECYERHTGGEWRVGDEFWDGDQWVKLEKGL